MNTKTWIIIGVTLSVAITAGIIIYSYANPYHGRAPTAQEIADAKANLVSDRTIFNALSASEQQTQVNNGYMSSCYAVKDFCIKNPDNAGCLKYCGDYMSGTKSWDYVMPVICDKKLPNGMYGCW